MALLNSEGLSGGHLAGQDEELELTKMMSVAVCLQVESKLHSTFCVIARAITGDDGLVRCQER